MPGFVLALFLLAIMVVGLWGFFSRGTGPILLWKELRSFFLSPIAWVVLALVMLLNGFSFYFAIGDLSTGDRAVTLAAYTFNSVPFWLAYFFIFPVITMRLFAEEQKLGTIETLLTAPVTTLQVLLAKYFAALAFYCVLWVPSLINFMIFRVSSGQDPAVIGSLPGSYAIVFLLGVFNIAIGCLASALTKNQLVAAMACFTFCLLHFLIGYVLENVGTPLDFQAFVTQISTLQHVRSFIDGLVDSRPFVYYISAALLLLCITFHVLEFRKWKI